MVYEAMAIEVDDKGKPCGFLIQPRLMLGADTEIQAIHDMQKVCGAGFNENIVVQVRPWSR